MFFTLRLISKICYQPKILHKSYFHKPDNIKKRVSECQCLKFLLQGTIRFQLNVNKTEKKCNNIIKNRVS